MKVVEKINYNQEFVLKRLNTMFDLSTEDKETRDYAKSLFKKRNNKFYEEIKKVEDVKNKDENRNIQDKLKKWRLKLRKLEFTEKINALTFKELVPKA